MAQIRCNDGRTIHVDEDRVVAEIETGEDVYGRDIVVFDPYVNPGNDITATDARAALSIAHAGALNLPPSQLSRAIVRNRTLQEALARIELEADLFALDEREFNSYLGGPIPQALRALVGVKHLNLALASKLLYLKRPRLFPILDRYPFAFYSYIYFDRPKERNVSTALKLLREFRADGRNNLDVLMLLGEKMTAAANRRLGAGLPLSLSPVRVLDRVIWRHVKKRTG